MKINVKIDMRCHMTIDGVFIKHLVTELNLRLEKSRLEKIFSFNESSFVFQFYLKGERSHCVIDLDPQTFGAYLSKKNLNASISSQFLVNLKKQLEGGILDSISQHLTDRVLIFNFIVFDFIDGPIEKTLVFEAMGKHANLLLVKDGVLLDSYKKMFFESGRQLIPGAKFDFFPTDKKTFEHIDYSLIESPKMISQTYMGISLKLATYLFDKRLQIKDLELNPVKDNTANDGYFMDIFPFHHEKKYYLNLSTLLDDYEKVNTQYKQSIALFISKHLKKLSKKKADLELALQDAQKHLLEKDKADLIYASGLNLNEKRSSVVIYDQLVNLDLTLTLNQNAQKFYKNYHKAKRGISHITEQQHQNKQLLTLFQTYKTYLDIASEVDIEDLEKDLSDYGYKPKKQKIKRKQKNTPYITTITDEYATYLVGKNDSQNEYVTHQLAQPNDYFFHVKNAPGSHVIVKTQTLNEHVLRKASMLAAHFSSLSLSSSIPVDYTLVRHLKKIPKTPGYKVSIKNEKTMYIDIDLDLIKSYSK